MLWSPLAQSRLLSLNMTSETWKKYWNRCAATAASSWNQAVACRCTTHLKFRISSIEHQFQWNWFLTWHALAYDFLEALGVMEGSFGRVWGYVAQAWGVWGRPWSPKSPLGCILVASWRILEASWSHLGASWRVWRAFGGRRNRLKPRLGRVWNGFCQVFKCFFQV